MKKKPGNIQRMKLALFIPWDKDGRIYLGDNEFITRETEMKDNSGGMVKSDKGITLVRKKS